MQTTLIQHIKKAASKLRQRKLARLGGKEITAILKGLQQNLGFDTPEEAILFTALFELSCSRSYVTVSILAAYFGCQEVDLLEYAPALQALVQNGFLIQGRTSEIRLIHQEFIVPNQVLHCILDNRKPDRRSTPLVSKQFDRYDLCKHVNIAVQDSNMSTECLLQFVTALEESYADLLFIQHMRMRIPDVDDRALFYKVCYDFYDSDAEGQSHIHTILDSMYESYSLLLRQERALCSNSHPLIQHDLVELSGNKENLLLTVKGQQLLLQDDFTTFYRQYIGLDRYGLAHRIREYVDSDQYDPRQEQDLKRLTDRIELIEAWNKQIRSLKKIRRLLRMADQRALYYLVCDTCANSRVALLIRELGRLYPVKERNLQLMLFREGVHPLQQLNLVELATTNCRLDEATQLQLTDKGKQLYFEEDAFLYLDDSGTDDLIHAASLTAKPLFFNPAETKQLGCIERALQETNYRSLTNRLAEKGLSQGLTILLYGAPGTGKTESVLQWARKSGRDILHVDISATRSMWYGESEKQIKGIFTRYRQLCQNATRKPILLFNEADALFSTRRSLEGGSSIDQTENSIQNILLEELEKLDGILIATTNLAGNLDKAFERRFLFKVRLDNPSEEAKRRIWQSKIPKLKRADATFLAAHYAFSGGEIDNIVRKFTLLEVTEAAVSDRETLIRLCNEEKIGQTERPKVGFKR